MTASQVLQQVDTLLPNQYTAEQKLHWLHRAEGFAATFIGGTLPAEMTEDTVLAIAAPYSDLYRHYVEAQIHYCNGELERYNNAIALWNTMLLSWRDYRARTEGGAAAALKLC
ncbi:MAG: hypothetical protein E7446_05640 [Ruminococcaceae bacterium]|nr:hypothetical protein [Oscillospiraceae bacterium]